MERTSMSDQPKPRKKYVYPYIPKSHKKPTACLCGRPGYRYKSGGWLCERCDKIEDENGRRISKKNWKTQQPNAKYADTYACGIRGLE